MPYRYLSEYLAGGKGGSRADVAGLLVAFIAFLLMWWGLGRVFIPFFASLLLVLPAATAAFKDLERRSRRKRGPAYADEWLRQMSAFREKGELEERSHPRISEPLEGCARRYYAILQALQSDAWKALSRSGDWKRVADSCRSAAEELLRDAIWAARGAFRQPGGRRATFQRRCADPAFAAEAIAGVRACEVQLERLLEEVADEPFSGTGHSLDRARLELEAIRSAEEELRQFVGNPYIPQD